MKKITKSKIIITTCLVASRLVTLPVNAEDDSSAGLGKYILFDFDKDPSKFDSNLQSFAKFGWCLYFALGVITFGYKFAVALHDYFDAPDGGIHYNTKKELRNEVTEPIRGLALLIVGGLIFDLILKLFASAGIIPDFSIGFTVMSW